MESGLGGGLWSAIDYFKEFCASVREALGGFIITHL